MAGFVNLLQALYLVYNREVFGFSQLLVDSFSENIGGGNNWLFAFVGVTLSLVLGCSQLVAGVSLFTMKNWSDIALSAMAIISLVNIIIELLLGGIGGYQAGIVNIGISIFFLIISYLLYRSEDFFKDY